MSSSARRAGQRAEGPSEEAELRSLVSRLVGEACGLAPESIEVDRPLVEYGLGSRDAVGITGQLEQALGLTLPATLMWENPSLAELVRHLAQETVEPSAEDRAGELSADSGPVAVVGIGCRLPGGVTGPDDFWRLLLDNHDAVGEVPEERWKDWGESTKAALSQVTRWGAFLDEVTAFDAEFFGIAPREAQLMDPQQRLLLEVAWEALAHAGMPAPALRGSATGVYVGLSSLEYGLLTTADLAGVTEWTSTGAAGSIAANRVSYSLDLRGPSLTVDTACSSSLVALHQACAGLRSGECDTALAAGVNVLLSPVVTAGFEQAGVLAPRGRCRPFDGTAEGIVRGEGCGVLVLKRLSDAEREGLPVLALVRGTAVNSDGRSAGLVAPNPAAQRALLRAALRDAGVDAREMDYVEAHGTGTLLGDPIEAGALSAVFGRARPARSPLLIGAVKSNLGHLEGAAGVVGAIKTVLSLHHGLLPATLHFHRPNPHIDFEGGRLRVVSANTPWPDRGRPALAGVSAFGFGGTNAHAVFEQWTGQRQSQDCSAPPYVPRASVSARTPYTGSSETPPQILLVSAASADRLPEAAAGLADWLERPAGRSTAFEDLTHTLGKHRYGPACAAVVGREQDDLVGGLRALSRSQTTPGVIGPRVTAAQEDVFGVGPVFVFSGYGSQWAGMGRRLLLEDEAFADAVRELDVLFVAEMGHRLSQLIRVGAPTGAVALVQPLLYGLQVALAHTWRAYGVEPAAVIGHSMGEVAAAVVAGALNPMDGLRVVMRRSGLLATAAADGEGAMAVVELSHDERAVTLSRFPGVDIAVDASPLRCTVAGPQRSVASLVAELEAKGAQARMLDVGGAGHSGAVDPVLSELRAALAGIRCELPKVEWYGTVHDDPRDAPWADADYWCANVRRPVRFRQAVATAAADGHRAFLEISPHAVAALPLSETLDAAVDGECLVLPTLLRDGDEPSDLRTALAALHLAGLQRDPDLLWPTGRRTSLPTAPWRHTRHWIQGHGTRGAAGSARHALLGDRCDVPGMDRAVWQGAADAGDWWSLGNQVGGTPVLALAACAEIILAAAVEVFDTPVEDLVVRDLALDRLLPLAETTSVTTLLDRVGPGRAKVGIYTRSAVGTWTRHAAAAVQVCDPGEPDQPDHSDRSDRWDAGDDSKSEAAFTFEVPATAPAASHTPCGLPPTLLDATLRAAAAGTGTNGDTPEGLSGEGIPVAVGRLRVRHEAGTGGACRGWSMPAEPHSAGSEERAASPAWSARLYDEQGKRLLTAERIVLNVLDVHELPLAAVDAVYDISWESSPQPRRSGDPADLLLLSCGPGGSPSFQDRDAAAVSIAVSRASIRVTLGHWGEDGPDSVLTEWRAGLDSGAPAAVMLLCTEPSGSTGARDAVLAVSALARGLIETAGAETPPRLFVVTERSAAVTGDEEGVPDRACLRGLLRVLALEHPDLRPCLIDVGPLPDAAEDLAGELLAGEDADLVAWREGTRFIARLSFAELTGVGANVPFARPGGAYIVTGGLGGLGLATARRLAERGAGRLVLNGRRPPGAEAEVALAKLRTLGTDVEVVLGDIAEPDVAPELVSAAIREGHTLRGVAHAAGVLRDGTVGFLAPDDLDAVFRPKIDGARHLDAATQGHALDWWVVFSSAAALLGSPGQSGYAAANAWLDALVQRRRARGVVGQSIAWGPWAGTGAAPDMSLLAVDPIALDDGLDILEVIVGLGRAHTGVVRVDADRVARAFPGIDTVPYFGRVLGPGAGDSEQFRAVDLQELDSEDAAAMVGRRLVSRLATIMGFSEGEIDPTVPLTRLGLDSLMAVRLRNAIKQDFGVALTSPGLLRGDALDDVTAAVLSALGECEGGGKGQSEQEMTPTRAAPSGESAGEQLKPALPEDVLPRDAAERLVAGAWTQVTGSPVVGVLRELDGVRDDPALSGTVAEEIRTRLGNRDAALTGHQIRRHPTVASVADLVRPVMEAGTPGGGPLRVLRERVPGSEQPWLFVFHPAGGSTSVYRPLTDLLPLDQPVLGLDRVESLTSVEDKAEHYLGFIREVQAKGPYLLLGWSFGGCLAYQTAVRLRELGEDVGYLGLIDTILPAALPDQPTEELLTGRFVRFAEYVEAAYGKRMALPYTEMAAMDEKEQVDTLMRHLGEAGLAMSPGVMEHQRTSYLDARVGERYEPRSYPGPVVLYRAQQAQALTTAIDPRYLRDDDDLGWAPLCPSLDMVPVPGDHLSLIDPPHVEVIAAHLAAAVVAPQEPDSPTHPESRP